MKANCSPVKDGRRYNSVLDAILALDSNSFDSVIKKFNEIPENNAPLIKREFHGKIVFCNYGSGKTFASSLNKLQFADDKFLSAVIQYVNNPGAVLPETIIPNHYLLESDYLFERIAGFSADQFEGKNYKTEYEPNMVRTAKAMNILAKNGYTIATNVTYSQYMESGIISKENCSAIYNASNIELSTVVKHRAQLENKKAIDYEAIEKKNNQLKELEGKLLEGRFLDVTHSSKRDIGSVLFEENRWSRWNLMNQRVNSCIERYGITEVQKALHEIAVSYINTIENNPNISKKVKNKFGAIENYAVYEFLGDTKKNTLQVIREQGSIELDNQTRKNIMRFFFDNKNIEDLKPILEECKKNNVVPIVRISLKQDHNEIKSTIESLYNERLLIPMNTSIFDSQDTFFRDKLFVLPKENDEQTTSILYEILTGTPAKLKELGGITYIDSKIAPSTEFLGKEGIIPEPQGEVAETPLLQKKENPIITIDSKDKNGQAASLYADKLIKEKGITNEDILYIDESFTKLSFSWLSTTINGFLQRGNKIIIGKSNPFYNYYKENLVFPNVIETEIKEKDSTLAVFFLPVQKNDSQGIKESTGKETTSIVSESKQKLFDEFLESSFAKRERDKMVNASYTFKDGTTVENLKYEPGEQQKEALSKIEDFIDNDKKYFVLKGYAGTGKTTIAKIIADKLSQEGRPFFFTASTNTAAGVLKKSVNEDVQTYQHLFGFIYKQGKKGGESIESVGYDIEKRDIPSNFVLLVDESSMITDSDFKKLSEILDKKNGKVIFLGDSAQLRPVQNKASNTKSKIFRLSQEEGFDSGTDMFELTDVMRNSGAILKEATRLRGKDGKPNTRILTHSMIDKDNRGIIVTRNENDELRKYVEKILKENNGKLNDNVFKALAFTNERTNQLNEEIRRYFHNFNSKSEQPISRLPIKGDYLTLNQNLEDKDYIYFAKGDTIQVDEVTGISKQHIKFKKGESVNEFDLTVTNYAVIKGNTRQTIKICDIDTEDINKTPEQLEIAKSNKKTLMEYKNNASLGENGYNLAKNYGIFLNADLSNLVKDEKTGNIKVDQKVKARSRTISFGYAMTIHKSQGQTLNNVVIDEDDIVSKTFDKEFKGELLYTAFTRAKDSVLAITSSASTIDPTKGEYENFEISTTINGQTIAKTNQEKWQQVSSIYSGPYKELASRVFDTCSKLDINLEQVTSDFIESNTELANRGYFRPDQNTVFISQYHQNNSEVLLHEAIHALTSWAIDNVETINDSEITIAVNNIKDIYKALRLNGLNLTNEKELIAELSSTEVRKEIERLSLTDTVINAVKKICSRLFGKTDKYAPTDALAILEDSLDTILRKVNKEQIEANVEREKNRSIIMTYLAKLTQDERDAIEYHHLIDGRFIDNEGKDLSDKKLKEIANSIGSKEVKLFNYDPSNNIYDEESEKYYQRGYINDNLKETEFGIRDFPQFIKGKLDGSKLSQEIEGKLEADKDRLIDLLGSSMYSEKLKDVVYKELLQNSFDAIKIAESKGLIDKGKIDIVVNEKERIISFEDNGIGMTSDIVQKAFFTIGGTYKGDDVDNKLKSGGLGLAKMAFIFGSEELQLETIHNGIKTTVYATSEDIRKDNFKIKTESTTQKNGTKVAVKIPKTYIDSKGENRDIDFPKYLESEFEYSFLKNPLIGNVDVYYSFVNRESSYDKDEKIKTNLGNIPEGFILFTPAKTSFADMDIYIDTKNVTRGSYLDTKHKILSSGLYQFNVDFKTDDNETIPLNIIIDIKPKVDATNAQYPFNNQRENFKPTVKNDIGALNKYLTLLWHSIEIELLKNSFNKIKSIDTIDVENVDNSIIEKNKEITKEFTSLSNSNIIKSAIEDFTKINEEVSIESGGLKTKNLSMSKEDIDKDKEKAYNRTFKAEKEISINKENSLKLDSNKPIIHNNTNMLLDEKATRFLSEISSIMIEYKKSIINFYGENYSDNIKDQLWGVSIDKNYGGINVNPSFINMLAINPFYNFPNNPKVDAVTYLAVALDHLIIHELNHNFERNEGAGFTGRFLTTYSEVHSLPNYFELISKLKLSIKNNLETIKKLNYEYEKSENVESGFEGNKLEKNNQTGTNNGIKALSSNDTSNDERTKTNDNRSGDSIGEQLESLIISKVVNNIQSERQYQKSGSKEDIEGFEKFINNQQSEIQYQRGYINDNLKETEFGIRDLAAKLAHRIGGEVKFISDLTKDYSGYNEGNTSVINLAKATLDTVPHEIVAHPIMRALKVKSEMGINSYIQQLEKEGIIEKECN